MSSQKSSLTQSDSLKQRSHFYALAIVFLIATMAHGFSGSHRNRGLVPSLSRQQTGAIANNQEALKLSLDQPVEKTIADGQAHDYAIQLEAGQFAALTIQQRGVDVSEQLFSPDGRLIIEFDDDLRPVSEDRVAFVAETSGMYRLQVKAKTRVAPGRYEIKLTVIRPATEKDRLLHEAHKLEAQSLHLSDAGRYDEALPLAQRALEMSEKELGPEHVYVAQLVYELGVIYFHKEDHAKARLLYERALTILEKELGPEHPRTAEAMRALGGEYVEAGEFPKADQLLSRALEIAEKTLGRDHPEVAYSLYTLGLLSVRRGESEKGEQYYLRARTILEKTGTENMPFANLLNVLAQLNFQRQDYKGAEQLLQRTLSIYEKLVGPEALENADFLQNLGTTVSAEKDYTRAEAYYLRALAIREKSERPDHPNIAWTLNNLGNLYRAKGDYPKAAKTFLRAVGILEKSAGPYQQVTLLTLGSTARAYAAIGDLSNAIKFQRRVDATVETNLALNLTIGSERQKLAFLKTVSGRTDRTISLNLQLAPNNGDATALATLVLLQRKGRVLDSLTDTMNALRKHSNAQDLALLDQLHETTAQLARLGLNGPEKMSSNEYRKTIKDLEEKKEGLESEISRHSEEFRAQAQTVTLEAVQASIPNNAALIEFATYHPFNPKAETDKEASGETRYAAYVMRRQGAPQGKDLGPAKEIDSAITEFRNALRDPQRKDVQQLARTLDEKVMRPVRALIGDATQLLISPDGELNLIPFGALVDERERYLIERYAVTYLTSGRDLLRLQVTSQSKSPPVVVADPAFGDPPLIGAGAESNRVIAGSSNRARIDYSQVFFGPLPGVTDEVRALRELLPNAKFLTREQATTAALQSVVAPSILHIATHGFFLAGVSGNGDKAQTMTKAGPAPVPGGAVTQNTTRGISATSVIENPLLRSGLALAGANLRGNGGDDGILTALEASGLNLWGTKLVVLSACDTGLGEVRNGEGVYGLRRAFVLAGAESQVMSLWPVSDRSTRELMVGYYKGLLRGQGRGDALRRIQLQMLRNKNREHPYYWASFIQTGAWTSLEGKR